MGPVADSRVTWGCWREEPAPQRLSSWEAPMASGHAARASLTLQGRAAGTSRRGVSGSSLCGPHRPHLCGEDSALPLENESAL